MARFTVTNNEDCADLFPGISSESVGDVLDIETQMDFQYEVPSVHTYAALVQSTNPITVSGIRAALIDWNSSSGNGGVLVLRYQLLAASDIRNTGVNRSRIDISGLRLLIVQDDGTTINSPVQVVPYTDHFYFMDYSKKPSDLMAGYGLVERIHYHQNNTPTVSASRSVLDTYGGVLLLEFNGTVDEEQFYSFMQENAETQDGTCVFSVRTDSERVFAGYLRDDTEDEFSALRKANCSISIVGSCYLALWNEEE